MSRPVRARDFDTSGDLVPTAMTVTDAMSAVAPSRSRLGPRAARLLHRARGRRAQARAQAARMQQVVRSSRRAAAEHGASTSAEPAIWGRQAARQRSGWGQQDNAHGELATQTAEVDATPLLDIAYHTTSDPRDALGRITKKTEWLDGTTTTWTYTYDSLNRLHVVTKNGQPFATYTYDLNGNRLTVDGSTTIATHDDQDRLLSYDGTTYTYGQNGELKTKTDGTDTTTYTYDALNNLRQVVLPNADTIEYLVDGLGRRVGKKKNGTLVKRWLFKDQLEPIAEIDEPSGNVRRFIYASRAHVPDLMIDNTGVYRLLTDQLGSVRLVVRVSDGAVVQHIDYDPWGVPTVVTGDWTVQGFGFAGGVYDAETGFVRFGARDYDARVGRWTAKDPIRFDGGDNLLMYALGDPVGKVDLDGRNPIAVVCRFLIQRAFSFLVTSSIFGAKAGPTPSGPGGLCTGPTAPPPPPTPPQGPNCSGCDPEPPPLCQ
ncbi:MAG: RHS repeat-associated core domain-containing protein [Polyangiaceae bacterium]|nr:RHS repeat-associated core domain-containing protein [Polyangiaceae bacterium]